MKNRVNKPEIINRNRKITVNLICEDGILCERGRIFSQNSERLDFIISSNVKNGKSIDVYLLPAHLSFILQQTVSRNIQPVIAYGNCQYLSPAFLAGCSDFLKDPWTFEEMEIRISKLIKVNEYIFSWGVLEIQDNKMVTPFGSAELTFNESSILKILFSQRGTIVPREVLFYSLWGELKPRSRIIDMYVSSLRKKIKSLLNAESSQEIIKTVYNYGYMIPLK